MVKRVCEVCGESFNTQPYRIKQGKGKYCSRECYALAPRKHNPIEKIPCTCQQCGKGFEVFPYVIKDGEGKYCSRECYDVARGTSGIKNCLQCGTPFMAQKQRKYCSKACADKAHVTISDAVCLQCGKVFRPLGASVGKYCSMDCANQYLRDNAIRVQRVCKHCGKLFEVKPYEALSGRGKYCSRKCYSLGHSGINNPLWRGGKKNYRGENWNQQRRAAHKRDGGVCQVCGYKPAKGKRKNAVHHIKPYRDFHGDYIAANNLSNLITLCHSCHPKAERGLIPVPKRLL